MKFIKKHSRVILYIIVLLSTYICALTGRFLYEHGAYTDMYIILQAPFFAFLGYSVTKGFLDLLFIDMPPGTGDVPLTVFQSIPIAGIVIVTTPQDLVKMVVEKAMNMANMMNIPVLGLVENMSYLTCPDCGKKIEVFGHSKVQEIANEYGIMATARMPLDKNISALADTGRIEDYQTDALNDIYAQIEKVKPRTIE